MTCLVPRQITCIASGELRVLAEEVINSRDRAYISSIVFSGSAITIVSQYDIEIFKVSKLLTCGGAVGTGTS